MFPSDSRASTREAAWQSYAAGRVEEAIEGWSRVGSPITAATMDVLLRVLEENDVEYMRAPGLSWAQLQWLSARGYVQAIFAGPAGGLEDALLMASVQAESSVPGVAAAAAGGKVITSFTWKKKTFEWVDVAVVLLRACGFNDELPATTSPAGTRAAAAASVDADSLRAAAVKFQHACLLAGRRAARWPRRRQWCVP